MVRPDLVFDVENGRVLCDSCRVNDMLERISNGKLKRPRRKVNDKRSDQTGARDPKAYSER